MSAPAVFDTEGYAYRFPLWNRGGTEDDCGEFLLYVRPRLPAIVARYEDLGKPFAAYLGTCLRYEWMTYCKRQWRQRQLRDADAHIGRTLMASAAPAATAWTARTIERGSTRRRIVAAAVKACSELDDAQVAVLAESTGRADLAALIARGRAVVNTARADKLRRRMTRGLGYRLSGADNQYARAYGRAAAELRRVRNAPSNREVAEILGIPKGTVDGWLCALQRAGRAA